VLYDTVVGEEKWCCTFCTLHRSLLAKNVILIIILYFLSTKIFFHYFLFSMYGMYLLQDSPRSLDDLFVVVGRFRARRINQDVRSGGGWAARCCTFIAAFCTITGNVRERSKK
jgi:hypothetical protein